jgi:hypothetical protein
MQLVGIRGQQFPSELMKQHLEGLHRRNRQQNCRSMSNLLMRLQMQQVLQ